MAPDVDDDPELALDDEAEGADDDESGDDEPSMPPSVIVQTRAPDTPRSKIVGEISEEQALRGAVVTFAITSEGRKAAAASDFPPNVPNIPPNLHTRPHPRVSPMPTRVATSTRFDGPDLDDE